MAGKEDIRQAIRQLIKVDNNIDTSKKCYVRNISGGATDGLMICDCEPLDGTSVIQDVILTANFDNNSAGLVLVPKLNSIVVVSFVKHDNDNAQAFVSMFSEVDQVYINGNAHGGLVKIDDLKTQYDANVAAIKSSVLAALAVIDTQLVALGQAGGSSAAFSSAAASILNLNKVTLENTKVRHGNGLIS